MIEDLIRSAFEHIDEDASDEFRDALHARLLAELVGHDTTDDDENNAVVVSLTASDAEPTSGPRWPNLVAAAAVVLLVSALVVVTRDDGERQVPAGPPAGPAAEHGLIAFSGGSGESRAESDSEIYVVAPDGTGLRALTSTPGVFEMAPRWSPDGTRLAFLRNGMVDGELVVIDPSTGVETFSDVIPNPGNSSVNPPTWSPDGRLIVFNVGNSGQGPLAVDLETGAWTPMFLGGFEGWSPDGRWFVLYQRDGLFLVPADLFGSTDLDDVSNLPGVRLLQSGNNLVVSGWMPDSSAVAINLPDGSTDVVTIADGQRRTLIEDGVALSWSPDGSHMAYVECPTVDLGLPELPADMAAVDPRQPGGVVWVAAADRTSARAVATSLQPPIWSPDGSVLIAVGEDGLFMVRPDGTGMTRLTQVMTPESEVCHLFRMAVVDEPFAPAWQPVPPSAETVADAVLPPVRVVTTEPPDTTEPSAITDE